MSGLTRMSALTQSPPPQSWPHSGFRDHRPGVPPASGAQVCASPPRRVHAHRVGPRTRQVGGQGVRAAGGGAQSPVDGVEVDGDARPGDEFVVVARGGQVGGGEVGELDLTGCVQVHGEAVAVARGEGEPAHPVSAAALLGPDVGGEQLPHRCAVVADGTARVPVGVRLSRAVAEPLGPVESRGGGEDRPDPGQVVEPLRNHRGLLDQEHPGGERGEHLLVEDRAGRGEGLRADDDAFAVPLDVGEGTRRGRQALLRPAVGGPAEPVVVGGSAPQTEHGRGGQPGVDEEAQVVHAHRGGRSLLPHRGASEKSACLAAQPHLRDAHLGAARRPHLVGGGADAERQPCLAVGRLGQPGENSAGTGSDALSPGPRCGSRAGARHGGRVGGLQPPFAGQPRQVAEVLVVGDQERRRWSSKPLEQPDGCGDLPVLVHRAGFGVRSGRTSPSAQKVPSWGSSPKSPPYAQR
ncbi:hypothetical protein SALBM311S_12462 [Streptomyces alboniger]